MWSQYQEVFTYPLGPTQVGQAYYNRAGIAVCGAIVYGLDGYEHGLKIAWCSRVLDKTAAYTTSLFSDAMKRLKDIGALRSKTTLNLWSDTGTHFRCSEFMATLLCRFTKETHLHIGVRFGLEAEFKSVVDGFFAVLKGWRDEYIKQSYIHSVDDFIDSLHAGRNIQAASGRDEAAYWFINFLPAQPKSEMLRYSWDKGTLPVPMRCCHVWSFHIVDQRRMTGSVFGRLEHNKDVNTAVEVRCGILRPNSDPENRGFVSCYKLSGENEPDLSDDEAERPPCNEDFDVHCKEINGWRTSFLKKEAVWARDGAGEASKALFVWCLFWVRCPPLPPTLPVVLAPPPACVSSTVASLHRQVALKPGGP
jgi:hypothetical protein